MLRRTSTNTAESETAFEPAAPQEEERVTIPLERRKSDRRGIDQLRAEALRTVISQVEDRNFGGLRNGISLRPNGRLSRLMLIVVAIAAGGFAAVLSLQRETAPDAIAAPVDAVEVMKEARARVLVANRSIATGQRLAPDSLAWEDWPEGAVRPEYLTEEGAPDAPAELAGRVVKHALFAGEPIREEKLAQGDGSYLATVLDPGMRGVSVAVSAEAASGGFIAPGDRVDVLLTRAMSGGAVEGSGQVSQAILRGVRVLAINARLGEESSGDLPSDPEVFGSRAIATLELDARQAEVINTAMTMGQLTLLLRSSGVADDVGGAQSAADQAIRLTSPFWSAP